MITERGAMESISPRAVRPLDGNLAERVTTVVVGPNGAI
jgi:hypothetical protein